MVTFIIFNKANKYKIAMYFSSALSTAIKIESNTNCMQICSLYCSVNFVTLQRVCLAFIFIASTGLQSSPGTESHKEHRKKMQHTGLGGVGMFIRTRRAKLTFSLIFSLRLFCSIYYRHKVFLKLRKILIQQ